MTLFDTLYTYLNSNWSISGVTKPVFRNQRKLNVFTETADGQVGIQVNEDQMQGILIDHSSKGSKTLFSLYIHCRTEVDRDKFVQETKDLLNITATTYIWQVMNVMNLDHDNWSDAIVSCEQWSEI